MYPQAKHKNATLLRADFWLQHVADTSNEDSKSDYSRFWRAQTQQLWPEFCCLCGAEPPTCGAHMFSIRPELAGVVIVPACAACNSNTNKGAKYAATKFNVWAAHVSVDELQRIERRQRQTARHLRAEARIELIQTLPPAGVPVPVAPHTGRKKYVPRFCVPPDDGCDDSHQRAPTPLPPSPASEPDTLVFQLPPPRLQPQPKSKAKSAAAAAAPAPNEYETLLDRLDEVRRLCAEDDNDDDVTPRPVRRRERAPARQRQVINALREVNRCKQPIEGGAKYCNSTVCSKLKCSGSSKVYCCAHCGCLDCVKPAKPSKLK